MARLELSQDVTSPRLARDFVAERAQALSADDLGDVLLLVSELVTNAVLHGETRITVQVEFEPPLIAVSVHDQGLDLPPEHPSPAPPGARTGRGLFLVDAIPSRWGVTSTEVPPGKAVWFRLDA